MEVQGGTSTLAAELNQLHRCSTYRNSLNTIDATASAYIFQAGYGHVHGNDNYQAAFAGDLYQQILLRC